MVCKQRQSELVDTMSEENPPCFSVCKVKVLTDSENNDLMNLMHLR